MVIYVGVGGTNSGILAPDELSGFNGFGRSFDMLLNEYSTSTHKNIFYRDFELSQDVFDSNFALD